MGAGEVHESVKDEPSQSRERPSSDDTNERTEVLRRPIGARGYQHRPSSDTDDAHEPTELIRRSSIALNTPHIHVSKGYSDDLNEPTELLPRPAKLSNPYVAHRSDSPRLWYDTSINMPKQEFSTSEQDLSSPPDDEESLPNIEPVPDEPPEAHLLDLPSVSTGGSFADFLSIRLVQRIRFSAIVLVIACVAGLAATPDAWLLLCLGMVVSGIIALLPKRLMGATAPAIGTLIGLGTIVIVLSYFGAGMALTVAALTAVTMSSIIPLPPVHRTFQVSTWVAMFVGVGLWTPVELAVSLGFLGLAWWVGRQYLASVRAMWRDRLQLEQLTDQLALEAMTRDDAIQRRENELLEKQDRIVQQERWATLGRVAVGVGHEIKNPLHAAMGSVDLARRDQDFEILDDAMDALERIHNILQDLSQFRTAKDDLQAYELSPLIQKVLSGSRLGLGNLRIRVLNLPTVVVQAERARLLQVFANLLTNAWHAVERQGYGEVRVHGEVVGNMVRIYVDDDGPGIPTSKHDRIFEAFVTTKRVGKGSGLGLPVSRGILRAMQGDLYCEEGSVLGGTRMTIQLSLAPRTAVPVALPERMSPPAHQHVRRSGVKQLTPPPIKRRKPVSSRATPLEPQLGTVMVVDDDPSIRKVVARTLEQHWHVVLASGSAEARQILRQEHVDVVLCDMHLAQEDAIDVITVVEQTRRSLLAHLVFMSGEPTSGRLVLLATANKERCMSKPFNLNQVLSLLNKARGGKLPLLELATDQPTPVAVIEPAWSFDLPTEELDRDEVT